MLVLSELDPALNASVDPATFDMRNYSPKYALINGEAYPDTDPIAAAGGDDVLLRYVNAGIRYHSMTVEGARQRLIGLDGSPLTYSQRLVAETFGPGQTADAIVTVPASTADTSLAVADASLLLHNSNSGGFGGMLTFMDVTGSGAVDTGPVATDVGYAAGTLTAQLDDPITSQSNVVAAEYFLDTVGSPGTGTAMTADTAFDSPSEAVTAAAVAVPAGAHALYVRGQDANGYWGVVSSVLVDGGDDEGPVTESPTLVKNPTNATADVALHATGNDSSTGNTNIAAAEFTIDGGSPVSMTVNLPAPIASLDAAISAATVGALSEGTHVVSIRSQDASGNWGLPVTIDLIVDRIGPATSAVTATPNPNNGTLAVNASTPAVRVRASLDDAAAGNSRLVKAEAFIDAVGADGSGIPLAPTDGAFDSPTEDAYTDIPLATILQMTNGNHTIYVHAKDAAGNWGATSTTILLIDKSAPTVSAVLASPNPTNGATSVSLTATATDALTSVTAAEWWVGADPGVGNGTPMSVVGSSLSATIDVATWMHGSYTLRVRARDAAGNWSTMSSTVLVVPFPGLFFSTVGNTNPPGVGGTADDADIYNWNGSAYSRAWDATAFGAGGDVDGYHRVDATHFYLSYDATTTIAGLGTVQDEDIVFYDAGTWSIALDGSTVGLNSANEDIDAFSIVGGTVYISTLGNTNPPGVGGAADDADIYRWNGGASFTRVWDATANGVAAGENVDGYDRIDNTHFHMSFTTNTTLPGLGTIQDEDVVYYDGGTWRLFFDGTSQGLTSDNEDIDALDVP